jgi:hypothetical protein
MAPNAAVTSATSTTVNHMYKPTENELHTLGSGRDSGDAKQVRIQSMTFQVVKRLFEKPKLCPNLPPLEQLRGSSPSIL